LCDIPSLDLSMQSNPLNFWHDYPVPMMRTEPLYGDRLVHCFTPRPSSVYGLFASAVANRPDSDALLFEGQRWSYQQCQQIVAGMAAGFSEQGLRKGERVILFVDNRPEFVWVLLALQRLGCIVVPVGVREQRPGLAYIARQSGASAIVADADLAARVPDAHDAPALRLRVLVGAVDQNTPDFIALNAIQCCHKSPSDPEKASEADTAFILYTSGTTGNPKGAMLTHLNVVHSVLHYQACMRLQASDRSALAVPASHVTGLIAIIAAMLHVGGAIAVVPAFKAERFIQLLATERITHTLMVPAMYNLCLMQAAFASADLSAWRVGGYGGAPMPVATIDALTTRLPGLVLINAYGATETTSPATMMPMGHTRAHADSVGVPLPAADIRVMDGDGRELPAGETGELWIGGPMVVPGYWANPEATATSFTDGYWHSGDLGSVDAQGYVRVFDRMKDMLNRGGYKVYSVEVENALMAWPGMVEAAVVARPCPVLGERVHAFVHAPGQTPDDAALLAHCAARLADYKVPESLTWSENPLPRNANGKLMKRVLREQLPLPN
jgi:long-chain acyl-CoA synthetase